MSSRKRSPALLGIEIRTDTKGRKRYRGTAHDKSVGKYIRGPWTESLAEARSWRIDAQARLQAGTLSAAAGPTVAEAAEEFIADMKSDTFRQKGGHVYKPSTIRGYERDLNNHVIPELGSKRIGRLQRPELQRWGRRADDAGSVAVHDQEHRRCPASVGRLCRTAWLGPAQPMQRASTPDGRKSSRTDRLTRRSGGADRRHAPEGSGHARVRRLRRIATW